MASNSESGGILADGGAQHSGLRTQAPAPPAIVRSSHPVRTALLTFAVHFDAFRLSPAAYLKATAWRLRGLKVRSRNTIAPLLGRSPRAYRLWIARSEPRSIPRGGGPVIVPVIDCRHGTEGLAQTIASIARSSATAQTILIGGDAVPGTSRVDRPTDLAAVLSSPDGWICPLRPGNLLAPGALAIYAAETVSARSAVVYADDDLLSPAGERHAPHFKPQWNAELFEHHDFLTGASIIPATVEALAALPDEQWARHLVSTAIAHGEAPRHVPRVLHHRRQRPDPVLPAKVAATNDARVTVIIPTRNQAALLGECLAGLDRVGHAATERIVIDNGSDDPATLSLLDRIEREGANVLRLPGPFNFSALNNEAVRQATGEYLCFLNNDVEMIDDDWLGLLVGQASRSDVGAVGARLLYPDRTVQHAGVFTGIGGGAGHGHRFQREDESGYFERARLPQQVSAVTAACLVVARDKFLAVGGFDETDFPVAFNDVDLCLKLNARGWQAFYEPRATLIHHESKSRGKDSARSNRVRFAGELAALKRKWHTDQGPDPFHHPHLSPFSEQFVVAV